MSVTAAQVLDALRVVQDPELNRGLVELGMIRDVRVEAGRVDFEVVLTTPACPFKATIRAACEQAVRAALGSAVEAVHVRFGADVRRGTQPQPGGSALAESVRNVVLVGAGKGGVGKSTVSVNLAVSLALEGARVGLLDTDVYGPSLPIMLGIQESPRVDANKRIVPLRAHGIELMSAGFLIEPGQAVVWRGPMLNSIVMQFMGQVAWGDLDYLIVDLPPGTGDVQITISQHISSTGAVLVATPQEVAMADVRRAKDMFDKVRIPVLGLIENMSLFTCDGCGKVHDIFATGGGQRAAAQLGIAFLGKLPIDPAIRDACDRGVPFVVEAPEAPAAKLYREVARTLAARIAVETAALPPQVDIRFHESGE